MFENISIGVKSFLRDEQLFNTIHAIRTNLPGAQMIIADCGEMTEQKDGFYAEIEREGHVHIDLPFDSGFGVMSNAIADALDRPMLLIGSDDFDFSTSEVRQGILRLQDVLDTNSDVHIASGRVNNNPYEFDLIEDNGVVTEQPINCQFRESTPWFAQCDLTVNFSLIRKEVFRTVRWDAPEPRIGGGEHAAFFLDCKKSGFKTAYVPGVNVNEQRIPSSPRYRMYRRRAMDPARPCFKKRGIKKYIMGNGTVDFDAKY